MDSLIERIEPVISRVCAPIHRQRLSRLAFASLLVVAAPFPAAAQTAGQSDWSAGPRGMEVAPAWNAGFASAEGVSWLAVPGQLTLGGEVLDDAVKHVVSDNFGRPASLDAADLDGDGDLDLVGAAFGGNEIRWWRNEGGSPPVWTPLTIETGFAAAASIRAVDLDDDGRIDVAGCAWTAGELAVWINGGEGVEWTRQSIADGLSECHWVDAADLDGDGNIDLMTATADPGWIDIWLGDGGSPIAWTRQVIDDAFGGARSVVPADLDADGDPDLLGTALVDNELSWWRNDGGEPVVWTELILSDSLDGAHHADAWDLDLDGDPDIVGVGFGHPWVMLWRNHGADPVGWSEEQIDGVIITPLVVDVGDLDGDGDHDVVATSNNWNRVMWWPNNGGPVETWEAENLATGFPNAWPLTLADLDDDGRLDVVSGASAATEVAWWRTTDFITAGSIESTVLEIPSDLVELVVGLDATIPARTQVAVQIRVGPSIDDLGGWTAIEPGEPLTLLERGPSVLQYRIALSTEDPAVAPVVRSIDLAWSSDLPSRQGSSGRRLP